MNKVSREIFSEKGLTLIEILASIVILFIIITSLITFFIQSSNTNVTSKKMEEATYHAQNSMEELNNLITITTQPTDITQYIPAGYTKLPNTTSSYEKSSNPAGHVVQVDLVPKSGSLVTVKVRVYDSNRTKLEAKMEMYVSWKQ